MTNRLAATRLAMGICAVFAMAGAAQVPLVTSIWQRIRYPPVTIPGTAREQLTFLVSSGGHRPGPQEEPSHLRLDLSWSGRDPASPPDAIARARDVVVKVHTADGKVLEPQTPRDWIGIGSGGGTTWSLVNIVPWSRNALDEAWFEVRAAGQTWWIELPYGFARNPEDPEVPDRDRGVPRFPPAMRSLGAGDILVPWLAVEYEIGRADNQALLSLKLSNPFDARASVVSYQEPTRRLGPDTSRQNLDTPRVGLSVDAGQRRLAGRELARRLSDDRHTRTDDFTFDRTSGLESGRAFGTVVIALDGESYRVRVPSSLYAYVHGRTDPENTHWMAESR